MSDDERIVQEHEGYHHGERVQILTSRFEDEGVFAEEEGTLHICEVGSEKYGNKHVALYFLPDESEEPLAQLDVMMAGEDWETIG